MEDRGWMMGNGEWGMGVEMEIEEWRLKNGGFGMGNGGRKMENEEWRMENEAGKRT